MSFNIRYGTADDGEDRWENRRELVIDVFRNHAPDVVGVQEALRFQLDEIRAALPIYGEVGVGRDDGQAQGEYSAILYRMDRFEVIEQGTFWFSETPNVPGSKSWGAACPRICTWATLKERPDGPALWFLNPRVFQLGNVHLDHVSQESREMSVKQLLAHVSKQPDRQPVIIIGDFNAGEDNPAVATLKSAGWVDSHRKLHPEAANVGTYHAWSGTTVSAKIDYIFAPLNVDVIEAKTLRDHRQGRYPSDHFPIIARIRLTAR